MKQIYDKWYTMYLFTAIGFPPGGSGRLNCAEITDSTKWDTIHKTLQKHGIHKIENKEQNKKQI
jgi:hypothetical protein